MTLINVLYIVFDTLKINLFKCKLTIVLTVDIFLLLTLIFLLLFYGKQVNKHL